jgi:hypothetical protein
MNLNDYFKEKTGTGILSTADAEGRVDAAIYARPHVFADGSVAFLMRERLTYQNMQSNPHAAYLFIEGGGGYRGIRLFLKKLREDQNPELVGEMTRSYLSAEEDRDKGPKHVVYFSVEKTLPLIGDTW